MDLHVVLKEKYKSPTSVAFAKPSDGLEPSTPALGRRGGCQGRWCSVSVGGSSVAHLSIAALGRADELGWSCSGSAIPYWAVMRPGGRWRLPEQTVDRW